MKVIIEPENNQLPRADSENTIPADKVVIYGEVDNYQQEQCISSFNYYSMNTLPILHE
jgi:hypothetical protein